MSEPAPVVVAVEDDPQIRRFLRTGLESHGFQVHEAETGAQGIAEAANRRPDIVILDLGLPDMDGVQVVRRIREWSALPVIVLSARVTETDKVAALDAGADDYLTKPFGLGELLARIRVALRHAQGAAQEKGGAYSVAGLKVDLAQRRVLVDGREVHLTPIEYRLLAALVKNAGKVLTHRQLLKDVWGPAYVERSHYLRVHMAALRHKLEADPARPRFLLTEAGVGYRLAAE
ncbi:MAG TPA: response regulator [Burkholderiales bacterium]|nr:response regulator [Burkholderiales bacterium]